MFNEMPLPRLHLVFRKFKDGELVHEHDEPAHSWTRNAWNILVPMFGNPLDIATNSLGGWGAGLLGSKNTGGGISSAGNALLDLNLMAGENEYCGLLLGDSDAAFSINDHTLSVINWYNLKEQTAIRSENADTQEMTVELVREFLNLNSDETDILVKEVGLEMKGDAFGQSNSFLVARDVLSSSVPVAYDELLQVNYQIIFDTSTLTNQTGVSADDDAVSDLTGKFLYLGCDDVGGDGHVQKLDPFDLTLLDSTDFDNITYDKPASEVLLGTDGYIYARMSEAFIIRVNTPNLYEDNRINLSQSAQCLAFGNGYLFAGLDTDVIKIDPSDMTQVDVYEGHTGAVRALAFGLDGYLYSGAEDTEVSKIDPSTMVSEGSFTSSSGTVTGLVYGDSYLYVGGDYIYKVDTVDMTEVTNCNVSSPSKMEFRDGLLWVYADSMYKIDTALNIKVENSLPGGWWMTYGAGCVFSGSNSGVYRVGGYDLGYTNLSISTGNNSLHDNTCATFG